MASKAVKRASVKKVAKKQKASAAKKATKRTLATATKRPPAKRAPASTQPAKRAPRAATAKKPKVDLLDLSAFPPESLERSRLLVCLACVLDLMTRHLGLTAARAQAEIRGYSPALAEVSAANVTRPYVTDGAEACPYCSAGAKWLAPLVVVRIEGGKATDAARRVLLKKLSANKAFAVIEEKSTERDALYHWLAHIGASLNLDSPEWLLEAARHWLGRRLPKEDWAAVFEDVRFVRRSRELEESEFAVEGPRLFLAPNLFDEILLIQYLLSRSEKAGGLTFEGRKTLLDLFHRLRGGGYLRGAGVTANNANDALEQLVEILGGEGRVKFHYVVDRREFLARLDALKEARIPKQKSAGS